MIFCTQFSAQKAGNRILGHWCTSKVPSRRRGVKAFFDTVGYIFQTCWLLQFLLKPLGVYKK